MQESADVARDGGTSPRPSWRKAIAERFTMVETRQLPKGAGQKRVARRAGERDRRQGDPQGPCMLALLTSGGQEWKRRALAGGLR